MYPLGTFTYNELEVEILSKGIDEIWTENDFNRKWFLKVSGLPPGETIVPVITFVPKDIKTNIYLSFNHNKLLPTRIDKDGEYEMILFNPTPGVKQDYSNFFNKSPVTIEVKNRDKLLTSKDILISTREFKRVLSLTINNSNRKFEFKRSEKNTDKFKSQIREIMDYLSTSMNVDGNKVIDRIEPGTFYPVEGINTKFWLNNTNEAVNLRFDWDNVSDSNNIKINDSMSPNGFEVEFDIDRVSNDVWITKDKKVIPVVSPPAPVVTTPAPPPVVPTPVPPPVIPSRWLTVYVIVNRNILNSRRFEIKPNQNVNPWEVAQFINSVTSDVSAYSDGKSIIMSTTATVNAEIQFNWDDSTETRTIQNRSYLDTGTATLSGNGTVNLTFFFNMVYNPTIRILMDKTSVTAASGEGANWRFEVSGLLPGQRVPIRKTVSLQKPNATNLQYNWNNSYVFRSMTVDYEETSYTNGNYQLFNFVGVERQYVDVFPAFEFVDFKLTDTSTNMVHDHKIFTVTKGYVAPPTPTRPPPGTLHDNSPPSTPASNGSFYLESETTQVPLAGGYAYKTGRHRAYVVVSGLASGRTMGINITASEPLHLNKNITVGNGRHYVAGFDRGVNSNNNTVEVVGTSSGMRASTTLDVPYQNSRGVNSIVTGPRF